MGEASLPADPKAVTPAGGVAGVPRLRAPPGCLLVGEGGLQQQGLQLREALQHDVLQGLAHCCRGCKLGTLPLLQRVFPGNGASMSTNLF